MKEVLIQVSVFWAQLGTTKRSYITRKLRSAYAEITFPAVPIQQTPSSFPHQLPRFILPTYSQIFRDQWKTSTCHLVIT